MRLHKIAELLCNELFWLLVPLMFVSSVLLVLQVAFCLWRCEAKNTLVEDTEYAKCLKVYTDL